MAVLVLEALAVQRRAARRPPDQEAARPAVAGRPGEHRLPDPFDEVGGPVAAPLEQQARQPLLAELVAGRVVLFGDAVAEQREDVPRHQSRGFHLVAGLRKDAEDRAAARQALDRVVGVDEKRRVVPGVAVGQLAGGRIEQSEEQRDEAVPGEVRRDRPEVEPHSHGDKEKTQQDLAEWPDDRIWEELQARLGLDGWTLAEGPILEKGVTGSAMLVSLADRDFTDTFGEVGAMTKYLSGQQVAATSQLAQTTLRWVLGPRLHAG